MFAINFLLSTNIQTMPGFVKVLTTKDIPGTNSVYAPQYSIMPEEVSTIALGNTVNSTDMIVPFTAFCGHQ